MMDIRTYCRGDVIFRQGDAGDCMYDIQSGRVGIYDDYDGPNRKQLAELMPDKIFGEMGLLDKAPRSATAVALDDTVLAVITEQDFQEFFKANPPKVLSLMEQMSNRLRRTTKDYLDVCHAVYETEETEKAGKEKSESLLDKIKKFCGFYKDYAKV